MENPLEHAEHIAHAGHDHGDQGKLGTYIGITMAVLGVVLAFCAAKVGGERTELVETLVEQQNAHSKYQAQEIKHRVAMSNLRQLHAHIPPAELAGRLDAELQAIDEASAPAAAAATASPAPAAAAAPAKAGEAATRPDAATVAATTRAARAVGHNVVEELTPNKKDVALLANTVERYFHESEAADAWVESFAPAIKAHVEAQERYELAQLLAEVGIVVASVALLMKRRLPWFVALAMGAGSAGVVGTTYQATSSVVHEAEAKIEETGKEYRELRTRDRALETDDALLADVHAWTGTTAHAPAPAHAEPAHGGHHP